MNLATIIKKLKKQDQHAFKELVFTYTGKLMVVAKIYTANTEDAKDALQDAFVKIFQNIHIYDEARAGAFLAWMRKIVMNEALKKYRLKSYKMESLSLDQTPEPSIDPISFDNFEKEELLEAIHSLPLRYKQVTCLFALEGYSHKEIAELLNIEPSSSRAAYSRAKNILRQKMNPVTSAEKTNKTTISNFITSNIKQCI